MHSQLHRRVWVGCLGIPGRLASGQHLHAGEDGTATANANLGAMLAMLSGASITWVCKSLLVVWSCAMS